MELLQKSNAHTATINHKNRETVKPLKQQSCGLLWILLISIIFLLTQIKSATKMNGHKGIPINDQGSCQCSLYIIFVQLLSISDKTILIDLYDSHLACFNLLLLQLFIHPLMLCWEGFIWTKSWQHKQNLGWSHAMISFDKFKSSMFK